MRFSLRSLFVFVTIAAVLCALFAARWHSTRRQAAAAEWLRAIGANVYYDFERSKRHAIDAPELPAPQFLIDWLGIDFFADVISVSFVATNKVTKFRDADVHHLFALRGLQDLSLQHTEVTDVGLNEIIRISTLNSITVYEPTSRDAVAAFQQARPDVGISHWGKQ